MYVHEQSLKRKRNFCFVLLYFNNSVTSCKEPFPVRSNNFACTCFINAADTRCSYSSTGVYKFRILHICNGVKALHISQTLATSSSDFLACSKCAAWIIGCNVDSIEGS